MSCQSCGIEGPTQNVKFEQNIGMIFTRLSAKVERDLCRPCIMRYFRSYTLTTLFLGWWGLISFFMTIVFLVNNISQYWRARRLPEPGIAAMNMPMVTVSPSVASGSFTFKIIYGLIIWTVVLGAVTYHQVSFMEKHAPGLNSQLHSGEITDETDSEYAGVKIGNDIAALGSRH